MAKITYVESNGVEHIVEVKVGQSVMEGAAKNNIPGIDADCGGACACATCHVYIADEWLEIVGAAPPVERSMLDFANDVRLSSRLSCQIVVTDQLNSLKVHIPESQH